ncbi:hypothetical protein CDL15_Pgr024352 [Punica granatum]|uniref:TORTIFOLIA1/SINE1-2 N-terminal domain-containing protein n=1 Tax=Punica granatum TaxID=22663 RepID=A0A218XXC7_PUNGR|nr:hypothetical protein CDL15_Pgr024352 [Punica granatum]
MSPQKIKSPASQPQDLKSRVISCLHKLSDRDTLAVGTSELESIAQTLTPDTFSPFLACIHNADDSSKSPVRRQCVHILTLLSHSHGDDLSPHVSKMAAIIVRRLRDPDSAVRAACVASAAAIAAKVTRPPFSALLKPLTDALTTEQDVNSQIGAAMCVAAAVEAAPEPEPEPEQLKRLLPRAGKLLRSEGFKAKAAVLGMVGSIVGVGGVVSKSVLEWLVPLVMEFLSGEDWAARKAAAEALGRVAAAERELAVEHRASCLKCLEARRFDKVKIVRETMNRSLELWKEVADASEEVSASSHSSSSSPGNGVAGCFPSLSKSTHDVAPKCSVPKKPVPTSRSPPSDTALGTITKKDTPQKASIKNQNSSASSRSERKKGSSWKVEIAVPHSLNSVPDHDDGTPSGVLELCENEDKGSSRPETKRALFGKIADEKVQRFGAFKSGSRVVPFSEPEMSEFESGVMCREASSEDYDNEKEMQELSMVRKQLAQIENQQASLFELLQKFIGKYQSGMNSLETRVQGLEMALEEISLDLGLSSGRFPNRDSADNTCCKLPGADFLSSKFWRKAEGRYSTARLSSLGNIQPGNERFWDGNTNPFAEIREVGDYSSRRSQRMARDVNKVHFVNSNGVNGTSPAASLAAGSRV